jgi:cell wall-associated NlpC family hydrolase
MNYPNRVIKEGEKDAAIVTAIQNRLNEVGCGPVNAIGVFGPKTKAAVKIFQSTRRDSKGNPLEIDGKIGAITWQLLFDLPDEVVVQTSSSDLLKEGVNVAISQLGVMENPLGSNKGPEVNQYLASVGLNPGLFWCAAFVYWCFNKAAIKLGRANPLVKTGGCLAHWNNTQGKKITTDAALDNPSLIKPGHIFIINHGGGAGHTGIVEKVQNGFIHTIEGNSNDSGSRNGIGVFRIQRKISTINKGFIEYE